MKKILLFLTALVLSTSAFAQSPFIKAEAGLLQKNPSTAKVQQPISHRAQLAENQYIMGGYTTDDYASPEEGVGLNNFPGKLGVAIRLPLEDFQIFDGGKVVKIRVALARSVSVSRVFITPILNSGYVGQDVASQEVSFNSVGWNEVELTTPVDLDFSQYAELLIGFDYTQVKTGNAAYPLSFVLAGEKTYELVAYGDLGSGSGWYLLGTTSYGNLSVQAVVETELPEQKVSLSSVSIDQYVKTGETTLANLRVANLGKETISSVGFNYYIDDSKVAEGIVSTNIEATKTADVPFSVSVPADLTIGNHQLKVELTTIGGKVPAEILSSTAQTDFTAYINQADRQKHLIEHITSWTCTYCYLGYNLLRNMESSYDDIAWVALHGNQYMQPKDPYNLVEADYVMNFLGADAFPSASFNRTYIEDMAEGDEITYGIGYNERYISQLVPLIYEAMETSAAPTFVTLGIDTDFDADTRQLQIAVNGTGVEQAAQLLAGQRLTIYVTEAGLTGRQVVNGSWQNSFDHNNTLRAVLTSYMGDEITWDGDNFTFTTTYTVPADYVADNLSVVAFVAPQPNGNTKAMAVNNCEKVAVNTGTSGINSVANSAAVSGAKEYFTLDGRQVVGPQKGLNIIRMSDGTTRKVVIK